MAARTDLGAITGNPVLDISGGASIVFSAVNITAGSVAVIGGRYEGGIGTDVMTGVSDTAGGTWAFYEFSDNPRVWIGVSYNHPGGTGVVITATLGGNRGYRESYGRLWSGTVGESNPVRVSGTAEFTSTDASGGTFTLNRTTGGAGMLIGIMASYGSLASPITTNGTQLGTRATPTSYGALVYKTHTGAGAESLTGSGGNGLSNAIALEIMETNSGTAYSLTAEHGTFTLSGQTTTTANSTAANNGSLTLSGQTVSIGLTSFAINGTISLTGQDVTLTHTTAGAYVLTAEHGTLTFSGVESYSALAINAEHGVLTFNGQDVTLTQQNPIAYSLAAEHGTLTFNGRPVNLNWSGQVTTQSATSLSISWKIGL